MAMQVELVSPEGVLWSGEADMIITRTVGGGDIAFLPDHTAFVGAVDIGVLTVRPTSGGADEKFAVHGGFVEISNNLVTILSDVAEIGSQIDVERARRARESAEARMRQDDDAGAEAALRRANVRLEAAGHGVAAH